MFFYCLGKGNLHLDKIPRLTKKSFPLYFPWELLCSHPNFYRKVDYNPDSEISFPLFTSMIQLKLYCSYCNYFYE